VWTVSSVGEACEAANAVVDYHKGPRRRGDALYAAIFEATLEELTAVGYAELKMEHVANRARASKGSLYRRWPSRAELVVDAVHHTLPNPGEPPDTGNVREDVLGCLRASATLLNGASGEAVRGLMADTIRNPELMHVIRIRFIDPSASTCCGEAPLVTRSAPPRSPPESPASVPTCYASTSLCTPHRSPIGC
jgi:hypothetical protein